jgi:hypothetical protein
MSDLSCERMHELAPELALDILSGYERATAQAHLGECPDCREYVGSLTRVSDRLLTLVPGAEPPVGFEDRVLSRMGLTPPPVRQPKRQHWLPIAVAAAVAAVVFGIGGWVVGGVSSQHAATVADAPGPGDQVIRYATFRSPTDQKVGQVFTLQGSPAWVYMSVSSGRNVNWVSCQLIKKDGSIVQVGAFTLSSGKGSWSNDLAVDPSTVASARLVSNTGAVLASASFANGDDAYLPAH